jgi:hypothetical protein
MDEIYSLRLHHELGQQLRKLAQKSVRTRAEVLRYLLQLAIYNPHLLTGLGIMPTDSSFIVMKSMNSNEEEVQP